jgi:hypothetical protein
MVWAVRARTDSIRTPGRPLRDSGVELIMLAFIECKNGLHEPTADTAEETEADLPATKTGSGLIRGISGCSKASSRITTGQRDTSI